MSKNDFPAPVWHYFPATEDGVEQPAYYGDVKIVKHRIPECLLCQRKMCVQVLDRDGNVFHSLEAMN